MILYSWEMVQRKAQGNKLELIRIIKYITYRPVPKTRKSRSYRYSRINWGGTSFIVNPEKIFENIDQYTKNEIAQYVGLASLRSYGEYKAIKTTTLDLLLCPVKEATLRYNRLLRVENGKVHFKWEDTETN